MKSIYKRERKKKVQEIKIKDIKKKKENKKGSEKEIIIIFIYIKESKKTYPFPFISYVGFSMNPRRVDNLNVPEDTKLTDKRSEFFFFSRERCRPKCLPVLGMWEFFFVHFRPLGAVDKCMVGPRLSEEL